MFFFQFLARVGIIKTTYNNFDSLGGEMLFAFSEIF